MGPRRRPARAALSCLVLAFSLVGLGAGCGGKHEIAEAKGPHSMSIEDIDGDPLVLLPSKALGVATVDVRAALDNKTIGPPLADLLAKLLPVGDDVGLSPARDVDRVTVASYALQGLDVAVVLSGRFDAEKVALAAKNHTVTAGGGALVESTYAGHTLYTVGNAGVAVLSKRTVVAGTEGAIRRALERLKDGKLSRDQKPWVYKTVDTKGAAFALAVDLSSQTLASLAVGGLAIPFAEGLQTARVVGTLSPSSVKVGGTATWNDQAHARAGAEGLAQMGKMAAALSMTGLAIPRISALEVEPKGAEVTVSFAVDNASLASLLSRLPGLL